MCIYVYAYLLACVRSKLYGQKRAREELEKRESYSKKVRRVCATCLHNRE